MKGYINGFDWINCQAMKYWSFAKTYKGDYKSEIKNLIFSGDYYGSLKRDGFYQRIVKDEDGNVVMISRNPSVTGEMINKREWVPHLQPFFDSLPNGTVLLCEIYLPDNEGSKKVTSLLGCLKDKCIARQEKAQKLHLYVFDICAWDGESFKNTPAKERFELINQLKDKYENPYVEWATYYNGKELWDMLSAYLNAGNEGMVITRADCPIYFKRTPARMTIKIKKEIASTIDCFFTGRATPPTKEYTGKEIETWKYYINEKTNERIPTTDYLNSYKSYIAGGVATPVTKSYYYEFAGSMEIAVMKDNKIYPIGFLSGLTEEIKSDPLAYAGRCIEVSAMEIDESGSLRHAKMLQFRDDLTKVDCTYEKVFGN